MADITTFINGLAGKAKAPRVADTKAIEKNKTPEAVKTLDAMLAERKGKDKDDSARIAYEKMHKLYAPTLEAALRQGRETPGALASKITESESATSWEDWKAAGAALAEAFDMAKAINAGRKKAYAASRSAAMAEIGPASGLTEIGGGAVAASVAAADALAAACKWPAAHDRLDAAQDAAARVNARAPFVRACRRHEAAIKAAFAITHEDLGKDCKAAWEQALKTAASGAHEAAAQEVEQLARKVDKARNSPALKEKREAVQKARGENVAAMKKAVGGREVDVAALRKLVVKEIGSKDEPASFAAQANAVGDDPGAKAREPIADENSAENLFMLSDWFGLKDMLHTNKLSPERMWDCWRYRQQYVTRLIDELRGQFPTLIAKTSGSTDLESDIDITFASTEPGDDVKAAAAFNKAVKTKFSKPPGRVFDVNIYPRDYNAIEESINPDYNVDPIADQDIDQPEGAMQKLSRVDQDVATLLKQRRFLDAKSFNVLMESVIDGAPDAATKKQIRKQFEEGEDIYLMTAFEKVDRIKAKLLANKKELPPLPLMHQFDGLREKGGAAALTQAQQLLPQVLDELEAALPDEVMEATDEVYLEKMGALRRDQTLIAKLDDPTADPTEHHKGNCDNVHSGLDHETWRAAEAQRLKAEVKKAQFTNIVFANEAYMSQGAIEHVVAGIQAKDPAKKEEVLGKLTPATLMQSCNEQLADFFKDMKAVEKEIAQQQDAAKKRRETGEAFVHASKYLVRLLDAAQLLADKFARFEPPVALELSLLQTAKAASPKELMGKVEAVLLALRKSSTVPADAKGEVGFDEARALFGVDDIGAFRQLITAFGAELNQQVRRNPEFKAELAVDRQTERQFFGVPPMPEDLKQLLAEVPALLAAQFGEGSLLAAIGDADGEAEAAQELLDELGTRRPVPEHLATQIEDALIRAGHALAAFPRIDPKSVLAAGAGLVRQMQAKIQALELHGTEDLHEAHAGDLERASEGLRQKAATVEQLMAELKDELKEIILRLGDKVAALKKALV
jgi:hypothetical protein